MGVDPETSMDGTGPVSDAHYLEPAVVAARATSRQSQTSVSSTTRLANDAEIARLLFEEEFAEYGGSTVRGTASHDSEDHTQDAASLMLAIDLVIRDRAVA